MSNLNLLHERDRRRRANSERLRLQMLGRLRAQLAEIIPGAVVWVYGSLVQKGRFGPHSDIDIVFEQKSGSDSIEYLQSVLSSATGHRVDIDWIDQSRLAGKIRVEGERWIV